MSASRSRRLQKKLRIGEFQQFGFNVDFKLSENIPLHQSHQFWDSFICDAIEANRLSFGGSESGFVVPEGRISSTEIHRQMVRSWLEARDRKSVV